MEYKLSSFQFSSDILRDDKHFTIMKINSIRHKCPSDANFTGTFHRKDKIYSGEIRILFSKGQFVSQATATNMQELLRVLIDHLEDQVALWKEIRFDQKETFIDYNLRTNKNNATGS
ncbi:MAG: hypothetical protein KDD33_00370 [Bdellovibrionales bacterium]|nr:hypothetical protein [Bdellovibrionales bacterium]